MSESHNMSEPYSMIYDELIDKWRVRIDGSLTSIYFEFRSDAEMFIKHMNWVAKRVGKEDEQSSQQAQ